MKKQAFFVSLLSVFLLAGCTVPPSSSSQPTSQSEEGSSSIEESSSEDSSSNRPEVVPDNDFHTQLQYDYLTDPDWQSVRTYIPSIGTNNGNPRAISLKFDDVDTASTYYVQVSKGSNDFTGALTLTTTKKSYDLVNAELNETYYYKAAVSEAALASASVNNLKVTDLAPRNLNVGGVINFRDVGGWKSSLVENGVIKQGLLYRCGALTDISTVGKQVFKDLNIKLDIDMRDTYQVPNTSPANTVAHPVAILKASIASNTETERFSGFASVYKSIFEVIDDADTNPIALHCTHGADRTGITLFFLEALLGVSKEDCGRDYSFTRYAGTREVNHEVEFDGWVSDTEALAGDTFAEKMKNHLLSKGISEDTLETIREKFVPGYSREA